MRTSARLALSAAALALLAAPSAAPAADDYFLQIPGVQGSSNVRGLEGAIPIDSFRWAISNSGGNGGGGGAGRAQLSPFRFTKPVDQSSPVLFGRAASGQRFASVRFIALKSGESPLRVLEYCMTDVAVTRFGESADTADAAPEDAGSLEPATFAIKFTPQKADGTPAAAVLSGWNLVTNRSIGFSDTCGTS